MFYSKSILIGSIVYVIVGMIMLRITTGYLKELEEKVEAIDPRFCKKLYFYVSMNSKWKEIIVDVLCLMFWGVVCISSILKAEYEYSYIRHHFVTK